MLLYLYDAVQDERCVPSILTLWIFIENKGLRKNFIFLYFFKRLHPPAEIILTGISSPIITYFNYRYPLPCCYYKVQSAANYYFT